MRKGLGSTLEQGDRVVCFKGWKSAGIGILGTGFRVSGFGFRV